MPNKYLSSQMLIRNQMERTEYKFYTNVIREKPLKLISPRKQRLAVDAQTIVGNFMYLVTQILVRDCKSEQERLQLLRQHLDQSIWKINLKMKCLIDNGFKVVAVFDGKKTHLQRDNNKLSNKFPDRYLGLYREIRQCFIDRWINCLYIFEIAVIFAPFEADYQILSYWYKHQIDLVYAQDKIFINHSVPFMFSISNRNGQAYGELIDISSETDRSKSNWEDSFKTYYKITHDINKRAIWEVVFGSKYLNRLRINNEPLSRYQLLQVVDHSDNLTQFYDQIQSRYHIQVDSKHRIQAEKIRIYNLIATVQNYGRLQYLNPALAQDYLDKALISQAELLQIVGQQKETGYSYGIRVGLIDMYSNYVRLSVNLDEEYKKPLSQRLAEQTASK